MDYRLGLYLLIGIFLCSAIQIGSVQAQAEFTDVLEIYEEGIFSTPYSPRISCNDVGQCVMLYWDTSILGGQGIKLYYYPNGIPSSIEDAQTKLTISDTYISTYPGALIDGDNYDGAYMYDVQYWDNEWFLTYMIDGETQAKVYAWNTTYPTTIRYVGGSGGAPTCVVGRNNFVQSVPIGFYVNSTNDLILVSYTVRADPAPPPYAGCVDRHQVNHTGTHGMDSSTAPTITNPVDPAYLVSFLAQDVFHYYIKISDESAPGTTQGTGTTFMNNYPCPVNRILTGDDQYIYGYNYTTEDIYRVEHNSYTTWGTCENYTSLNSTSVINGTDISYADKLYWVHEFKPGETGNGFYSYNTSLNNIKVISYSENLITEDTDSIQVSVLAECVDSSGSDLETGDIVDVSVSCDNIKLSLDTSEGYPNHYENIFTYPSECETLYITNVYYESYDLLYSVYDTLTELPISGALIDLSGDTETTDSNGKAELEINPLQSATFINTSNPSQCQMLHYYSGTARTYDLQVTKDGYKTHTEYGKQYANPTTLGEQTTYEFDIVDGIGLDVDAFRAIIKTVRTDGQQVNPHSAIVRIQSNSTNYYKKDSGGFVEGNNTIGIPAEFLIYTNETYLCANITLEHGTTETKEVCFEDGVSETQIVIFTIDFYCRDQLDCLTSYCDGNVFKRIEICDDTCRYSSESCVNCDDRVGCYQEGTSTDCSNDLDCRDESYCSNKYTSMTGVCGSDELCKLIELPCGVGLLNLSINATQTCNPETGLCFDSELCFGLGIGEGASYGIRYPFFIAKTSGLTVMAELYDKLLIRPASLLSPGAFAAGAGDVLLNFLFTSDEIGSNQYATIFEQRFDADFYCGINDIGSRACIYPTPFPYVNDKDIDTFITSPTDWVFTKNTTANTYNYYPVSVECKTGCRIEYDFCENGCNPLTGFCNSKPIEKKERTIMDWIDKWLFGWASTQEEKIMMWLGATMFMVILSAWKTKSPFIPSFIGLIMILIGFLIKTDGVPLLPTWLFLILAGLTSLGVIKLLKDTFGG